MLFACFDDNYAYLINVFSHQGFSDQEILRILHRNWPHSIERYKVKGIKPERSLSNDDLKRLRKANVLTLVDVEGCTYFPPGGGYQSSGLSTEVLMISDQYFRKMKWLEDFIKGHIGEIHDQIVASGRPFGPHYKFRLVIGPDGDLLILEAFSSMPIKIQWVQDEGGS